MQSLCVAGEQRYCGSIRVAADEEIRKDGCLGPLFRFVATESLGGPEKALSRDFLVYQGEASDDIVHESGRWTAKTQLCINDGVDHQPRLTVGIELLNRPVCPFRVVGKHIDKHVGVDQNGHQLPRVLRIHSRVVSPSLRVPRMEENLSFPEPLASGFTRITIPPAIRKSTSLWGVMSRNSRIRAGIVTCPLVVTFIVLLYRVLLWLSSPRPSSRYPRIDVPVARAAMVEPFGTAPVRDTKGSACPPYWTNCSSSSSAWVVISPASSSRRMTSTICCCTCSTFERRTGPRYSISSRSRSAARFDMF